MNQAEKDFCDRVTVMGTHQAKYHTFDYVETILREGIPGDFVECGVASGGHEAIAAYVFRKWGVTDRKIHLFDSFEGVPKAGPEDCPDVHHTYGTSSGKMESSGKCRSSIANIISLFNQYGLPVEHLRFHKGWFEETMASQANEVGKIAFLRVDVDLYSSTKTCYQHMYGKLSPGAVVVDDDYGRLADEPGPACRRALREVIGQPANVLEIPGYETTCFWRIPT